MPQCQPVIERLREEASKYHRIYVTSIHPDLSESDLRTYVFARLSCLNSYIVQVTGNCADSNCKTVQ